MKARTKKKTCRETFRRRIGSYISSRQPHTRWNGRTFLPRFGLYFLRHRSPSSSQPPSSFPPPTNRSSNRQDDHRSFRLLLLSRLQRWDEGSQSRCSRRALYVTFPLPSSFPSFFPSLFKSLATELTPIHCLLARLHPSQLSLGWNSALREDPSRRRT